MDQKRLAGNAARSDGSRMASASIRNITKPRKASIDVIRVGVNEPTAGPCATVGTGSDTVVCMMAGILLLIPCKMTGPNGAPGRRFEGRDRSLDSAAQVRADCHKFVRCFINSGGAREQGRA